MQVFGCTPATLFFYVSVIFSVTIMIADFVAKRNPHVVIYKVLKNLFTSALCTFFIYYICIFGGSGDVESKYAWLFFTILTATHVFLLVSYFMGQEQNLSLLL